MVNTVEQFNEIFKVCRSVYENKLEDYGASWRMMRAESITDQLFIKAKRIRSLEIKKESKVNEGIKPEYIGLVNYGIIALIQFNLGFSDNPDITNNEALDYYDKYKNKAGELMNAKNHDYDEAWRMMRISSFTDFIITKLNRIKEIENNDGKVTASEGIDSNYIDIINYAVFALIKLTFEG
jgi:hypothetical protein